MKHEAFPRLNRQAERIGCQLITNEAYDAFKRDQDAAKRLRIELADAHAANARLQLTATPWYLRLFGITRPQVPKKEVTVEGAIGKGGKVYCPECGRGQKIGNLAPMPCRCGNTRLSAENPNHLRAPHDLPKRPLPPPTSDTGVRSY